jgi:hypothetical protein
MILVMDLNSTKETINVTFGKEQSKEKVLQMLCITVVLNPMTTRLQLPSNTMYLQIPSQLETVKSIGSRPGKT